MTTLKALNIEIVNILDKITEQWSHMTPIDQLIILKNKLNNPTSNIHLSEPKTTVDIRELPWPSFYLEVMASWEEHIVSH